MVIDCYLSVVKGMSHSKPAAPNFNEGFSVITIGPHKKRGGSVFTSDRRAHPCHEACVSLCAIDVYADEHLLL